MPGPHAGHWKLSRSLIGWYLLKETPGTCKPSNASWQIIRTTMHNSLLVTPTPRFSSCANPSIGAKRVALSFSTRLETQLNGQQLRRLPNRSWTFGTYSRFQVYIATLPGIGPNSHQTKGQPSHEYWDHPIGRHDFTNRRTM